MGRNTFKYFLADYMSFSPEQIPLSGGDYYDLKPGPRKSALMNNQLKRPNPARPSKVTNPEKLGKIKPNGVSP